MISFLKNFFSNEKSTEEQVLAMKTGGGCCGGGGHAHHQASAHTHDVLKVDGACVDTSAKASCGTGGCGSQMAAAEEAEETPEETGCCGGGCHR